MLTPIRVSYLFFQLLWNSPNQLTNTANPIQQGAQNETTNFLNFRYICNCVDDIDGDVIRSILGPR